MKILILIIVSCMNYWRYIYYKMKTEKELKKEIEELKKNAPRTAVLGLMLIKLQTQLKTLKERNAEVKQAINELGVTRINKLLNPFGVLKEFIDKQKLLQKLGLGEK